MSLLLLFQNRPAPVAIVGSGDVSGGAASSSGRGFVPLGEVLRRQHPDALYAIPAVTGRGRLQGSRATFAGVGHVQQRVVLVGSLTGRSAHVSGDGFVFDAVMDLEETLELSLLGML